jgi:hypothetical protein
MVAKNMHFPEISLPAGKFRMESGSNQLVPPPTTAGNDA